MIDEPVMEITEVIEENKPEVRIEGLSRGRVQELDAAPEVPVEIQRYRFGHAGK